MIEIMLREAMDAYEARTGERLTYADLADRTGLSRATIESMAARPGYNASLKAIDLLCDALRCELVALLRRSDTNREP
ncbi:MAG: helix-turn-helix transcriptional regulator [Pseudomonadota bacterium]